MEISKKLDGTKLVVNVSGRLDTRTAPILEGELKKSVSGITELAFDLEELEYVSSAGLRVFLMAQKVMNKQGSMVIKNVCDEVMDVFEITGFSEILTIE